MELIKIKERKESYYIWETSIFKYEKPYNYYNIESLNNDEIEDLKTHFLPQFKQAIFEAFIQLPKFKE